MSRRPVQVHSIADAERASQNYRWIRNYILLTIIIFTKFKSSSSAGLPFDESLVKSDKSVQDEEIVKLLKTSANPKVRRGEIEVDDIWMKYFQAARKKKKAAEKAVTEEPAPALVEN